MQSAGGESVMMGEVTSVDYGAGTIDVTPMWDEFTDGANQGNVYRYTKQFCFINGMNGSIDTGVSDTTLTVTDGSKFSVNDIVYLPNNKVSRRITNISSNDLTLHSSVSSDEIDANISDITVR